MASVRLLPHEKAAFAEAAHHLRWEEHAPIQPQQLLDVRRREDQQSDLYTTLNIVQENLIRGGLHGRNANRKRTTTRAVQGVTENVRLNSALSVLAQSLAKHKAN